MRQTVTDINMATSMTVGPYVASLEPKSKESGKKILCDFHFFYNGLLG